MLRLLSIAIVSFVFAGCNFQISKIDSSTGYFPTEVKADVVLKKPFDIDQRKSLLLVPNSEFIKGQAINIGYFDEVMDFTDLENRVIAAALVDKIPGVNNRIGVGNAAKHYKPFLWLRFASAPVGSSATVRLQGFLTDPISMEDLFVTETFVSGGLKSVDDQSHWYPMFNALIDYIKQNSNMHKK